ncbi:MAG TPA: ATP-binding protein [Opitutaceae bacterium]
MSTPSPSFEAEFNEVREALRRSEERFEAFQRQSEQQLRQSQRLESLGLLAEGVAHHFNNMLTIIRVNAELLSLTPTLPADAVRSVQQINEAAERSAQLTTQLLAFSRQQPESVGIFDLNDVVHRLTDLLQIVLGRKIGIDLQPAPEPVRIEGDVALVEQLLLALAINAREAMPAGGRFTIRLEPVEVSAAEAARHPGVESGRHARLIVRDTGVGMTPEVLARIFDAFYTTKGGRHSGLGLSSVHGYVIRYRGWIEATSAPGSGAAFTIYLPLAKPPPAIA